MSFVIRLVGVAIWLGVGYFDWWVWGGLLASGLDKIGSLVGFGILAIISFPVTILGVILGLLAIVNDS